MGILDGVLGAVGPAIGGLVGGPWGAVAGSAIAGGLAGRSQSEINAQNQANFQTNLDFQRNMSDTAHQREVADLIAAGLNPILSATRGGASTTSGSQLPVLTSPYSVGLSSAGQFASTAKTMQETETEKERTVVAKTEAEQARWLFNNVDKFLEEKLAHAVYTNLLSQESLKKLKEEVSNLAKEGKLIDAETASVEIATVLKKYQIPEAKAFADFFATSLGKKVPYIREIEGAVSSAGKLFQMTPWGRTFYRGGRK